MFVFVSGLRVDSCEDAAGTQNLRIPCRQVQREGALACEATAYEPMLGLLGQLGMTRGKAEEIQVDISLTPRSKRLVSTP